MILVLDTETTGLPAWDRPSDHHDQPHLVQLAAALCEDDTTLRASFSLIIRPVGWSIPPEAAAIHGIDDTLARRSGVPEEVAVDLFLQLLSASRLVVAHNLSFDRRILRIAIKRHRPERVEVWGGFPGYCTMEKSRDRCAIPPTGKMLAARFRHYKSPTLAEAYGVVVGKPLPPGWHDASQDMLACRVIYRELTRERV